MRNELKFTVVPFVTAHLYSGLVHGLAMLAWAGLSSKQPCIAAGQTAHLL